MKSDTILIPVNHAEAIIEPFFNGGTSDQNEIRNTFIMDRYRHTWLGGAVGRLDQLWDGVYAFVQGGTPGEACLELYRECEIGVDGYDTFIAFLGIPEYAAVTIDLTIDGVETRVADSVAGKAKAIEVESHFSGARLTAIRATFSLIKAAEHTIIQLRWFGLAHAEERSRMLSRGGVFLSEWPGYLSDSPSVARPEIGIYFGDEELDRIRSLIGREPFRTVFEGIRAQAEQDLLIEPEQYIGATNPGGTDRYIRVRDREAPDLTNPAVRLAFVGLVAGREDMSLLGARMALSLACCTTWDESVIGHLPGSIWHHRSFSQERAIKAASLVLDWAGHRLTDEAKRVIRDAIIMKGFPRLENDFRTMEYIRRMNQGIVFNCARIIGLLSIVPVYPRYRTLLDEAERDLHEMVGNYVHDDGGTLEGCGYWNYTFSNALPQYYLLARFHGVSLGEYATDALRKTAEYPPAMLSSIGDGTGFLPINDAHGGRFSPLIAAAFVGITDLPFWRRYYASTLTPDRVQPNFEHLVFHPPGFDAEKERRDALVEPRFAVLPAIGQVDSIRLLGETPVHLHILTGPVEPGHYHEDKGSFILEVGDDVLLIDRGICDYGSPFTGMMKLPGLHNLLMPENPGGLPFEQPNNVPGGRLVGYGEDHQTVWAVTDNTSAWETGLFERSVRRFVSPDPSLIVIDDEVVLQKVLPVAFNLHTRLPTVYDSGSIRIDGAMTSVRITPINWSPDETSIRTEGVDLDLRDVTVIGLRKSTAREFRLLTAIEILPADCEPVWHIGPSEQGAEKVIAAGNDSRLELVIRRGGLGVALSGTEQSLSFEL